MMTPTLLDFLRTLPGRCHECGHHAEVQGHERSCSKASEPFDRATEGMARTVAAHPDDAAIVDKAIESACRAGIEFSANDFRHLTDQISEPNVIGARVRAWAAAKKIVNVGYEPSNLPGTHAHRIGRYIAAGKKAA
ncbi:hypothetical protein [Aeromicrobium piscarium]|uniref:Uncharacterized protein n=1 Tax=Aeromicrobium piscarium TaxID=2590901 RepID=A0A554SP16_9ACTN|nr:hypothetical protein [Aeromicrobium piscarium]TSD68094.1 hypothetical protein FNM00_00420 [Aeromicrobium piscarium]